MEHNGNTEVHFLSQLRSKDNLWQPPKIANPPLADKKQGLKTGRKKL